MIAKEYNYIEAEVYKKEMEERQKLYKRKMRFTWKEMCEELKKRKKKIDS